MNKTILSPMLQKLIFIFSLFFASPSFGQHTICKEYHTSEQDGDKKALRSIAYYDKHGNITRKVLMSEMSGYDTIDYIYKNNLLVQEIRYRPIDPVSRPVDSVLDYIRKHPKALGQSLHHIVKQNTSDTELTRYYYNDRGLLARKENASFENIYPARENGYGKLDPDAPQVPAQRGWQRHRVTNYLYRTDGKLAEASGDLFDKGFGSHAEYGESARRYFYDAKNELLMDSIVSYNGATFDGAVSTYKHFPGGYEVRVADHAPRRPDFITGETQQSNMPAHYVLVFKLNDQGKLLEEARYKLKTPESKIEDPLTRLDDKNLYEYDSSGRLIKKSVYYSDTPEPQSIYYYTYE